jgi:hypothetical protein
MSKSSYKSKKSYKSVSFKKRKENNNKSINKNIIEIIQNTNV